LKKVNYNTYKFATSYFYSGIKQSFK